MKKVYPRTGNTQTVYLNVVVKDPSIKVGDYTIYNDLCPTHCFSSGTMCYTIILSTTSS